MRQFPQLDFSSLFVSALSLAMAACIVLTTHAQIDPAGLNGTVTDTSGKALSLGTSPGSVLVQGLAETFISDIEAGGRARAAPA